MNTAGSADIHANDKRMRASMGIDAVRVVLATLMILLGPLVAMQFTHGVQWTGLDFAVAAVSAGRCRLDLPAHGPPRGAIGCLAAHRRRGSPGSGVRRTVGRTRRRRAIQHRQLTSAIAALS